MVDSLKPENLQLTSQRNQRRRRRRSSYRTPMMTSSLVALLAMQMIRSRRIFSSKEETRMTSSALMMPQTATHKLMGKRRRRRKRAQFCHLSVWVPIIRLSTLRRYHLMMMMGESLLSSLVGVSLEVRHRRVVCKRTWRSPQPFVLSSLRTIRRRGPLDRSRRSRQTTILLLMMRTRRQRSSRAVVECLALRCSLVVPKTSSPP